MIKVIWPHNISLNYWAASLVTDYPNEHLPILETEDTWQEWATIVANTGAFQRANIPAPITFKEGVKKEIFSDWQKWAKTVYTILSDNYNISE